MRLFVPEEEKKEYRNDNPKGTINRQYESCVRKASYLAIVCAHWLNYQRGDPEQARRHEPFYDPPENFLDAKRFAKARKNSGAWERGGKRKTHSPRPHQRWDWAWVFDHWLDGGLERSIQDMLLILPEENRGRVKDELAKF